MNKKYDYEELIEYCTTPRQTQVLNEVIKYNSPEKAAKKLKIQKRGVFRMLEIIREKRTSVGGGEHFLGNSIIPQGLAVKGTSTFYDDEGKPIRQWVKTDKAVEDKIEAMRNAVSDIVEEIKGMSSLLQMSYLIWA